MAEFMDFGANVLSMVSVLDENDYTIQSYLKSYLGMKPDPVEHKEESRITPYVDPQLLQVRNSILVAGYNQTTVQSIKQKIAALVDEPLPLESLHVKSSEDLVAGSLLVPKVVLVAEHCPGRKLIDDEGDHGVLDDLYDAVCDVGADLLVIYVGLPRAVYPPVRHMVYHPRMSELLFPSQPSLRHLAENYSLITVLEKSDLTSMQKNVIREWLMRPVGDNHPVYSTASQLVQYSFSEAEFWSETEVYKYKKPVPYHHNTRYLSAAEAEPVAEKSERKRRKKKGRASKKVTEVPVGDLIGLDQGEMELEMYNGETPDTQPLVGSFTV